MLYILRWRHDTNDLTPAIESLGPDGQHMLRTSKNIYIYIFFGTTFLMPSKFNNLENPTIPIKPHTGPIRTKGELWDATETF